MSADRTEVDAGTWDVVVVGAGSCGSVLAARLSQTRDRRVLLVEAGPDPPRTGAGAGPVLEGYNWDYEAQLGEDGRRCAYRVGRVVGGSSAVNGAIALRALPADLDGWAAAGSPDWAWDRVLPWFRRIETDADFDGEHHGASGPVPVRRPSGNGGDEVAAAFRQACHALGLPDVGDLNAGPLVGVGPVPSNTVDGRRVSTAQTHLAPARARRNLTVRTGAEVVRVRLRHGRAVGVDLHLDGRPTRVTADSVVLCAGAVNTPALLMRSGIGPPRALRHVGVDCRVDLPGVGENLADHPAMAIWSLRRGTGPADGSGHAVMARAGVAVGAPAPDTHLMVADNQVVPNVPGIGAVLGDRPCLSVCAMLLDPVSRGRVRLDAADVTGAPVIRLNLAGEVQDVDRLMAGARLAWSVLGAPAMQHQVERTLLWTERLVGDDALLRAAVPRFVSPMWHPVGTARMGPDDDPEAVVDQHCRVRGVPGLWVVDASVFPTPPRATPNLTCIVLAERAAGWVAGEDPAGRVTV